jgi:hypothetical protein
VVPGVRQPVAFFRRDFTDTNHARGVGRVDDLSPADSPDPNRPCDETPAPPPGFLCYRVYALVAALVAVAAIAAFTFLGTQLGVEFSAVADQL